MEPLEQLLGSKSHLIIGQKFEIMLDIIAIFWEIWLDIVLNTSFFEAFRAYFRSKSRLIIGKKIEMMLDIIGAFWGGKRLS